MEKNKNGLTVRVIVVLSVIFCLGVLFGKIVTFDRISSLEGYLLNLGKIIETNGLSEATACNATDCNATSTNATSCNATDCNATSTNATSCNATDCNATSTNATSCNATSSNVSNSEEIYLDVFGVKSSDVVAGEKLYLELSTSGNTLKSATVILNGNNGQVTINAEIKDINKNPYIVIPANSALISYQVEKVMLIGINSYNDTFTKVYEKDGSDGLLGQQVTVKANVDTNKKEATINLTSLSLEKNKAEVNEKVAVNIKSDVKLVSAKLEFKSLDNKETLTLYVKDLSTNPHVVIPADAKSATYELTTIILESAETTIIYSKDSAVKNSKKLDFTSNLEITNNSSSKMVAEYNNENITDAVLSEINKMGNGAVININANNDSIIKKELFNVIKGKDKTLIINYKDNQIVFVGSNIKTSKAVDVTTNIYSINTLSSEETLKSLINSGIVVEFVSNGDLPGGSTARIKATEDIKQVLGNTPVYIYYFNEQTSMFQVIAEQISVNEDGYYEFCMNHNSKYIITSNKLDESLIEKEISNGSVVNFVQSNVTYILVVVIAIVIVIVVIIVLVLSKKNKDN